MNLEKSRQNRKNLTSVLVDGNRVPDINDILNEEVQFYKRLYKSNNSNNNDIYHIDAFNLESRLTDDDAIKCDGPIDLDEHFTAINGIKTNKSPGLDGISTEFHQRFSKEFAPLLLKSFEQCYTKE